MRKSPTLTGGINEVDCTESLMNAYESEINIYEEMRYFLLLPPPTKLRQGNVYTPVCHSVHIPRVDTPQADTSLGKHPPSKHTPGRHPHPHPCAVHTGYGQQAGGTHPTGMHSCLSKFGLHSALGISTFDFIQLQFSVSRT